MASCFESQADICAGDDDGLVCGGGGRVGESKKELVVDKLEEEGHVDISEG